MRNVRSYALILIDSVLVNLSMIIALLIRFDGLLPYNYLKNYQGSALLFTITVLGLFIVFGFYRHAWEYASVNELLMVVAVVILGNAFGTYLIYYLNGMVFNLPRSVILLNTVLQIILIGGSRIGWRLFRDYGLSRRKPKHRKRMLLVGAGDGGVLASRELKRHYNGSIDIVGFVDDDPAKQNLLIQGVPVLGKREDIPRLIQKRQVDEMVIAMPSASCQARKEIVNICRGTGVKVKILPGVYDLIDGKVKISNIREVEVEDLLGREPIKLDLGEMTHYLKDQVVLVTGGGGSIGSELCRQIAHYQPQTLVMLDSSENNAYEIDLEMGRLFPQLKFITLVKDVRDRKCLMRIFKTFRPQVVFHAAAHKHVPLMEENPEDAIKNNVMGTYNVAQVADMFRTKKFVFISTDKAVNPTSIMGASKRLAEMVIQYMDTISETSYVAVRFGNVLGSKGSVIPLFKRQIAEGGPVTVTHPEMVRYFMTIPEAVQLVIQAGAMAKGGEIFVLDMGDPVRIVDLANNLIELSGFKPGKDIEIKYVGIRPGEKLYEELLTAEEGITATTNQRIFIAKRGYINVHDIETKIISPILENNLPEDKDGAIKIIQEFLPDFHNTETEVESKARVV